MDGLTILRKYVDRRIAARDRERKRMAEAFAKEVEIYAAPHLARILPPEFTLTLDHGMRFNSQYVEIKPRGPTVAILAVKGASKEVYVSRTEWGTYHLFTRIRCKRCGELLYKAIMTPEELLAAVEDRLKPPDHECETLNTCQPDTLKIFPRRCGR